MAGRGLARCRPGRWPVSEASYFALEKVLRLSGPVLVHAWVAPVITRTVVMTVMNFGCWQVRAWPRSTCVTNAIAVSLG